MKLEPWNKGVTTHTEALRVLIEAMPIKRDRESTCQRLYLLNRLNDFDHAINGTCENDLTEEK